MNFIYALFGYLTPLETIEIVVRILLSLVCGGIIGLERTRQFKDAGIRTHCIITCAAAALMILSKYGFSDVGSSDPARLAAQIVTGIGFLGSGVIFKSGSEIKGLTSAAGIWATAAIGMTIGAGLYLFGIFLTLMVFLVLSNPRFSRLDHEVFANTKLTIKCAKPCDSIEDIVESLKKEGLTVTKSKLEDEGDSIVLELSVRGTSVFTPEEQMKLMQRIPQITSISY